MRCPAKLGSREGLVTVVCVLLLVGKTSICQGGTVSYDQHGDNCQLGCSLSIHNHYLTIQRDLFSTLKIHKFQHFSVCL